MILFVALLVACMLLVMYLDVTKFTIPNWLNATVLILYPLMFLFTPHPVSWQEALIVFGITFVCGVLVFAARVMGGGDIKLIMALAPWLGYKAVLPFYFNMALAGGALGVFILVTRPVVVYAFGRMNKLEKLPRLYNFSGGLRHYPMPYGVAIAISFLILLLTGKIPGLPL